MSSARTRHDKRLRKTKAQLVQELESLERRLTDTGGAQSADEAFENVIPGGEEAFRKAFDHAPVGVALTSADARFLVVNKTLCDMVGYSKREFVRKTYRDITHPDDLEENIRLEQSLLSGAIKKFELEKRYIRKDGQPIWVLVNVSLVRDADGIPLYNIGHIQDITDRIETEEALRESEKSLANAQRIAHVGSWERDLVMNVSRWSDEHYRIFGLKPEEKKITREVLLSLVHPDDVEALDEAECRAIEERAPFGMEHRIVLSNGEVRTVYCQAEVVLDERGRPARIAGTVQDITDRKRFEEEILKAKEEAELANRTKTEFLAAMSHELRTPLNSIVGFSDVIKNARFGPLGNDKYLEYVDDIHASANHLQILINDLLDVSAIDMGRMELDEADVNVSDALEACRNMVAQRADDAGITVNVDTPRSLPLLRADETRFKQIVLNLVANGIKFSKAGGRVTIEARIDVDGAVVLAVNDTGIGIAPDDIPKVLMRFGRVEEVEVRGQEGVGLGLTIVRSLAELHGATFELNSELGVGTTASVRFPPERCTNFRKNAGVN